MPNHRHRTNRPLEPDLVTMPPEPLRLTPPDPFAYRWDRAKPGTILVHPEESEAVRALYVSVLTTAAVAGVDLADTLAEGLNAAKVRPPLVDGRTSADGWTGPLVRSLVGEPRHAGFVIADDAGALEAKSPPEDFEIKPELALVAYPVFATANEVLGIDRWPRTRALITAALEAPDRALGLLPHRSASIVPSRSALIAAAPAIATTLASDHMSGDDELADLPVKPSGLVVRGVERAPYVPKRGAFEVLGADALPGPSRRKLASSDNIRGRLRKIMFFYARFSTDMQEVKSEDRQFADIAIYATKLAFDEGGRYGDRGKSGKAMSNRAGLQSLMRDVRLKKPDAVGVEDLDRLSRRLPDLLSIFYELKLLGVELHDITLGKLDLIHIVMRGYMAEEGRVRFLAMSRQGKIQAMREGKLLSKGAYGYHLDPTMKGVHLVDEEARKIIAWIFKSIADGMSAGAVARDLTRRGVYPPAQWRIVRAGGAVASIKPWQAVTILKIIHNHVYLGWATLNRSIRVVDTESGKTRGFKQSDEKDWIVVKHEDLAIVDEEVWTRAALRLADLTYRGEQSVGRFLLTGKAKCACGAPLKAHTITEYTSYYECTSRVLGSGCAVRDHHRIEWLEAAVLGKLLETVLCPENLQRHAAGFEAEIARILKHDVDRAATIRRRLEKIDDLQHESFERHGSMPPARMAKIRLSLEREYEKLSEELAGLHSPASFLGVLHATKNVDGDLSRMMEEVPFRPTDPEGIAMANAVRDAMSEVVVYPTDAEGWTKVSIVVDYLARFREKTGTADVGRIVLETGFDTKTLRADSRRRSDDDRFGSKMAEAAKDRRYDLTADEWALVEPLMQRIDLERGGRIAGRDLLDGMICFARANGPMDRIPARYGDKDVFRRATKRFVYAGLWDIAKQRFEEHGCSWIHEPGFARFDTLEFQRRNTGARPDDGAAARAREELIRMAAAEPAGDPVRLRLELIAMILAKVAICDAARALGLSMASAYHHWDKYKAHGIDAVRRKDGPYKDAKLSEEQVEALKAIAMTGVDPDDPSALLTYPILCRVCEQRFGVAYSRGGMIQVARRHGFLLQQLVAVERRRRNVAAGLPVLPPAAPRRTMPLSGRGVGTPSGKKARRNAKAVKRANEA